MDTEKLKRAASDAIHVQNACNLSGVLHAWARHASTVADATGGNTTWEFFRHPVNVLFLSKVSSLMGVNADCIGGVSTDRDLFSDAYKWAQENS